MIRKKLSLDKINEGKKNQSNRYYIIFIKLLFKIIILCYVILYYSMFYVILCYISCLPLLIIISDYTSDSRNK